MEKAQKVLEVQKFSDGLASAKITICADYRGVTVAQATKLRNDLRSAGCDAKVYKNTLAKLSVEEVLKEAETAEKEKFSKLFHGPSFVVFGNEDPVAAAKVLQKFAKECEAFQVKGGWFDGSFLDQKGIDSVASLPGREESLAKLLYLLNTPATQLVRVLAASGTQVVRAIAAYKEKLEKGV